MPTSSLLRMDHTVDQPVVVVFFVLSEIPMSVAGHQNALNSAADNNRFYVCPLDGESKECCSLLQLPTVPVKAVQAFCDSSGSCRLRQWTNPKKMQRTFGRPPQWCVLEFVNMRADIGMTSVQTKFTMVWSRRSNVFHASHLISRGMTKLQPTASQLTPTLSSIWLGIHLLQKWFNSFLLVVP